MDPVIWTALLHGCGRLPAAPYTWDPPAGSRTCLRHEYAVRAKAEIMVDHFNESVFSPRLMGGKARAMVVTDGKVQGELHAMLSGIVCQAQALATGQER